MVEHEVLILEVVVQFPPSLPNNARFGVKIVSTSPCGGEGAVQHGNLDHFYLINLY